jgi:sulfoxide reductase heme-binding subunit YedZ
MRQEFLRKENFVFLVLVLANYPVSFICALFLSLAPIANIIGFLSLVSYIATLLPSIFKIFFPTHRKSKILTSLLKYRRHIGVTAFSFGLNHSVLIIIQRKFDLLDLQTYVKSFHGFAILLIFTLLATTSNEQAVKNLKTNWKKLQQLTYLVIFLLPWHILDNMSGHWTYLTPIEVLVTTAIVILFIMKMYIERIKNFLWKTTK